MMPFADLGRGEPEPKRHTPATSIPGTERVFADDHFPSFEDLTQKSQRMVSERQTGMTAIGDDFASRRRRFQLDDAMTQTEQDLL